MDADTIEKFRKVRALASGGATEGERTAARSVMQKMEQRYPGIGAAASAPPPPEPNGAFGFPPRGGFRPSGRAETPKEDGFIGSVFDFLRNAAAGIREGMTLRERIADVIGVETRVNSRTARITVTVPVDDLLELYDEFGEDKTSEIATIVASMVRDEFVETLSMGFDDPL